MDKPIFDTEHLAKSYFKLAVPVVMGMVVGLVYNLADTFFISQTGDTSLVAAISVCGPVFTTLMAFGNIYGQGGSSLISRLLGMQDIEGTRRVSSFCFYGALLTGAVIGLLMLLLRDPLLYTLGAREDTLHHAMDYYTVMALGAPLAVLNYVHCNLVRCEGMATTSMLGTMLGSVVNIVLDPILISVLKMGAMGAAIATVIGYLASVVFFLIVLKRSSRYLSVSPKLCRVSSKEVGQVFGVGGTAALTNLMQSVAVVMLNQYLLSYGSEKLAAMGITMKINMIAQLVLTGFAFGAVPLFGYLYGSGNREKLHKLIGFNIRFSGGLALGLTLVLFFGAPMLTKMFLDVGTVTADATEMLRWLVSGNVFVALTLLFTVLFQASGLILPSLLMSISRQGVLYMVALLVCAQLFGYLGILAAQLVADVCSAALGFGLYRKYLVHAKGESTPQA